MPKIGQLMPKIEKREKMEYEPGVYDMTLRYFDKPFASEFQNKNGETLWQLIAYYDFDKGGQYREYLTASTFDGKSTRGKEYNASKLFLRLKALTGCRNQEEADALDLDDIKDIPVRGIFGENQRGRVCLQSIKRRDGSPVKTPKPQPVDFDQLPDDDDVPF